MEKNQIVILDDRGLIAVEGLEAEDFLHNMVKCRTSRRHASRLSSWSRKAGPKVGSVMAMPRNGKQAVNVDIVFERGGQRIKGLIDAMVLRDAIALRA